MRNNHIFINPQLTESNKQVYINNYGYFYKNIYVPNLSIEIERMDYFLEKNNHNKLVLVGAKGNFMYKNFKKTASKYFEDCPNLVQKINSKEYKLSNLPEIIEYYKEHCN